MTHGHRFIIQSKSRDIKGSSDLMASSFSLITHRRTKGDGERDGAGQIDSAQEIVQKKST